MPTRQQSTMLTGAIRSLLGTLLLLFCFTFAPTEHVYAQESATTLAETGVTSGTVPSLITATVAEDADWTAINITLQVTETISLVDDPGDGTTRINGSATDVEYKPDADYCNDPPGASTDDFTYTIAPGGAVGAVNMTVTCVNDDPEITAPGGVQTINQDTSLTLTTISVDDIDAGNAMLQLDLAVAHGALTLASTTGLSPVTGDGTGTVSANGSLVDLNAALDGLLYTPTSGYAGNDSLAIDIDDLGMTGSGGAKSDSATVSITINAAPTVNDDTVDTDQEAPVDIDVLDNDTPNSGSMDTTSVEVKTGPSHGSATELVSGEIRYDPTTNYNGPDSFTYEACNTVGLCDTATVSIIVNALPPTVNADSVDVNEDTAKNINVLANDVANSGSMDTGSVTIVGGSGPAHGSATPQVGGTIRYNPTTNYNGPDSFTYRACNTEGLCATAVVNITVKPGNDGPTIQPIDDLVMIEGRTKTVAVTVNDIDNSNLDVTATSNNTTLIPNANLIVSDTGNNRTLKITAADNQIGLAVITVSVTDGASTTNTTFNVNVVAPDLNVAIDGDVSVRPGNTATYMVDYGNSSAVNTRNATGVFIDIVVPAHTQLNAGASNNGWNCASGGGAGDSCRLAIGALNRGVSGTAAFAVTVDLAVPVEVASIAVDAVIGDDGLNGDDSDPSNNRNGDTTLIDRSVLLSATKRDMLDISGGNDGIAGPGDRISYTVVLRNDNVTPAVNVVFSDMPDSNTMLEVGAVTTTQGVVTQGNGVGDSAISIAIGEIAPDTDISIEFSVVITTPVPDGVAQIVNQGSISGENFPTVQTSDPDTPNVGDATVTPLGEIPVLNAAKRASLLIDANQDGLASPGDTLGYTITLSNQGVVKATEVLLTDNVDPNTTLVTGSVMVSDPGANIVSGNNNDDTAVAIDVGPLNGEETVTVTFSVQINANLPSDLLQVANQGAITSREIPLQMTDNPDTPEPNDPTKTLVVTEPIIVALKTFSMVVDADNNDEYSPGDTIEYSISIRNDGTRASGVVFTDELDSYIKLTRIEANQPFVQTSRGTVVSGNNASDTTVVVTMDELGIGDSVNISFKVKIATPVPDHLLFIENQGVVSSVEAEDVLTDDPRIAGKSDPTQTPITGRISLNVTLETSSVADKDVSGGYTEGDVFNYVVKILNTGNRAAPEVTLHVPLDARTALFDGPQFPAPDLPWVLGTIPAGVERVVGIMVTLVNIGESKQVANQFTVSYYDPDEDMFKSEKSDNPSTPEVGDPTMIEIQAFARNIYLPIVASTDQ